MLQRVFFKQAVLHVEVLPQSVIQQSLGDRHTVDEPHRRGLVFVSTRSMQPAYFEILIICYNQL